jgi:hypothetical protein
VWAKSKMAPTSATASAKKGFWVEDGALDRLDKRVSSPLFRLVLPLWMEAMMTIPGTWSGIPPFSMSLLPIIVGAVAEVVATGSLFGGVTASAALALSVALCWWTTLLRSATFEKGPAQVHTRTEDRRTENVCGCVCVCFGDGTGRGTRWSRVVRGARVRARGSIANAFCLWSPFFHVRPSFCLLYIYSHTGIPGAPCEQKGVCGVAGVAADDHVSPLPRAR